MPVIDRSTYAAPLFLKNGHMQTIFPLLRKVRGVRYRRERLVTPDDDFLDLDWSERGAKRIAILSHGLEGNTQRNYVLGMIRALHKKGWDALAWNYRSCSGEPNRQLRWYHSGDTGDLETVIQRVSEEKRYTEIALIGFSLGGNITLKYLGERGRSTHPLISRAVAFSVPCDLRSSAIKLAKPAGRIYMIRFMRTLHRKVREKKRMFPGLIDDSRLNEVKTFVQFDDRFTAPIHGFRDAEDYFARSSSRQFLGNVAIPALLVNARNDPFLDEPSFPFSEANSSSNFFFEAPETGGHMGFVAFNHAGEYWSESRAMEFLNGELRR
jgi:predicted alpha/beta-fold hydrolase